MPSRDQYEREVAAGGLMQTHRRRDPGRWARVVVAGAVAIGLVAFALDNRREVRVGWVAGDRDGPLWLVIAVSALVGAAVAALLALRSRSH